MATFNWDLYIDIVVCSHVIYGDVQDKKVIKSLCKRFGFTPSKLAARVKNFEHIIYGKASFFNTCRSEREAFRLIQKHKELIL